MSGPILDLPERMDFQPVRDHAGPDLGKASKEVILVFESVSPNL